MIRPLIGQARNSIIVVTNEGTIEKPALKMRRPGMIPLDNSAHFKWFRPEEEGRWRGGPLAFHDQLSLGEEMYGADIKGDLRFSGCLPLRGIKVTKRSTGQVAWLASCGTEVLARLPAAGQEVTVDMPSTTLESKYYRYRFKAKNHMLFDSIELKKKSPQAFVPLAHDGDLLIYADVKNFFTLQFDSSDIESLMRSTRVEDFGALATIQFYLKILFFKITLDLDTDVAFFRSSAHIPMVLTVPKNAEKRLNPKSGILYSFVLDDGVRFDPKSKMPIFDANADQTSGGVDGYCSGDQCEYSVVFVRDTSEFSMNLLLPKSLVERGMYPRYVDDVVEGSKSMKWRVPKQNEKRRGLYFEVSRLPAGEHAWDLWLGLKP